MSVQLMTRVRLLMWLVLRDWLGECVKVLLCHQRIIAVGRMSMSCR